MHSLRRYFVLFALLAIGNCYAASFDCEKVKGNVEEMICYDGELSQLDEILLSTYKAVLAVVSDQGALKSDQRRWLTKTRNRCKDAECLVRKYEERISTLEQTWNDQFVSAGIAASRARVGSVSPFDGDWMNCELWKGDKICSSYTLVQQEKRLCGEWEYWATNRIYSGQLQAALRNASEAGLELICGRPGGEISTDCDNDVMPRGNWENAKGGLSICDGRLYHVEKATSCNILMGSSRAEVFYYHPLKGEDRRRLLEQPWVKRCLGGG